MKMRNIAFMGEKIYTNSGFIIKYKWMDLLIDNNDNLSISLLN